MEPADTALSQKAVVNAVHELAAAMCGAKLLEEGDRKLLQFIADATSDYYGEHIGISYSDEVSGRLTCAGTVLRLQGHRARLQFNIRYSITADAGKLEAGLEEYCGRGGYKWELIRNLRRIISRRTEKRLAF